MSAHKSMSITIDILVLTHILHWQGMTHEAQQNVAVDRMSTQNVPIMLWQVTCRQHIQLSMWTKHRYDTNMNVREVCLQKKFYLDLLAVAQWKAASRNHQHQIKMPIHNMNDWFRWPSAITEGTRIHNAVWKRIALQESIGAQTTAGCGVIYTQCYVGLGVGGLSDMVVDPWLMKVDDRV
jgi:hypothetical protein